MKKLALSMAMTALVGLSATDALAESTANNIMMARTAGEISLDEEAIALANTIYGIPDAVAIAYRGSSPVGIRGSATFYVKRLQEVYEDLSPAAKAVVAPLVRPGKVLAQQNTEDSQSGRFSVFYGDSGVDCSGCQITDAPTVAEQIANALDESWSIEVDDLGFPAPNGPGGGPMEVFVGNTGLAIDSTKAADLGIGTYVDGLSDELMLDDGIYGFASAYFEGNTIISFMVFNDSYEWAPGNADALTIEERSIRVTAAHEFNHATAFAGGWGFDANSRDSWYAEASAVAMEEAVFDNDDDYLQYLGAGAWPDYTNIALPFFNGFDAEYGSHEYGDVIFNLHLVEDHGGDQIIADIWSCIHENLNANDLTGSWALPCIDEEAGGLAASYAAFAAKLPLMNFEEGANFARPALAGDYEISADNQLSDESIAATREDVEGVALTQFPDYLGTTIIKLTSGGDVDDEPLGFEFSGEAKFNVQILVTDEDESVNTLYTLVESGTSATGHITDGFGTDYTAAYLIVANTDASSDIGATEGSFADFYGAGSTPTFTFSAKLEEIGEPLDGESVEPPTTDGNADGFPAAGTDGGSDDGCSCKVGPGQNGGNVLGLLLLALPVGVFFARRKQELAKTQK